MRKENAGRSKCMGRTNGDFRGSYPCALYAIDGSEYCRYHDPKLLDEREAQAKSNNLERFRITVRRDVTQTTTFEVDALSESEAKEKGLLKVKDAPEDFEWSDWPADNYAVRGRDL